MKESSEKPKAEKCGVCFFVNNKPIFTLIKTKHEKLDKELMENTYFSKK